MRKLKTLKDLNDAQRKSYKELGEDYGGWIHVEVLRKEAIKWVKVIKHKIDVVRELESKPQGPLQRMATQGLDEILEGQIKLLTDFFNLKEEAKSK